MIMKFSCPKCSASMAYSIRKGRLHCDHCGHEEEITADLLEGSQEVETPEQGPADIAADGQTGAHMASEGQPGEHAASHYSCPNCGGTLPAGARTSSTVCEYCGSGIVLTDRLQGDMRPEKVLAFSIDRDSAVQSFLQWCHHGRFSPRGFASKENISRLKPLYIPFWLYDMDADVTVDARATKVRTYPQGDFEVTETSFYAVHRRMDLAYHNVPRDASEEMNDDIVAKLLPYSFQDLRDFYLPHFAGFETDQRDYGSGELLPLVKEQTDRYALDHVRGTISGYTTVNVSNGEVYYRRTTSRYVYLPIWYISYKWKEEDYVFAMNGQTGKVVGNPPLSAGRIFLWFAGISAVIFAVLLLIGGLL